MMRLRLLILFVLLAVSCTNSTKPACLVENRYGALQMNVDGKPFLMLAGELHNSSASTVDYLEKIWPKIKSLNLNTVLIALAWEQFEPQEGSYDFTLIDAIIDGGSRYGVKVALVWFATWKNGDSSYVPSWVKSDRQRFFRVVDASGRELETVSPFCDAACDADARAFKTLAAHIRDYDKKRVIIAYQPENEVGAFSDMDYSRAGISALSSKVPSALMEYMKANVNSLRPELVTVWAYGGFRESGTWEEVFPDKAAAKHYCMTWQYATYVNKVATAARREYDLPTFCNAWLVQYPEEVPGKFPNGGPVSAVMDIWKAAAPAVDILSPDIYLPDFKAVAADYHRSDNPLLVPEAAMKIENAYYTFGAEDGICFSPFGIEDGIGNYEFGDGYKVLAEMAPLILEYQGSRNISAVSGSCGDADYVLDYDDFVIRISFNSPNAYGIIIRTSEDTYVVCGTGLVVKYESKFKEKTIQIENVLEGGYKDGLWYTTRQMNGDETDHNKELRVFGRATELDERVENYTAKHSSETFVYSPETFKHVYSAGIYKVKTYWR